MAEAHEIPFGDNVSGDGRGDAVPLAGTSPGLDHPPPGWGEGDRVKVMRMIGVKEWVSEMICENLEMSNSKVERTSEGMEFVSEVRVTEVSQERLEVNLEGNEEDKILIIPQHTWFLRIEMSPILLVL